MSKKVDVSSLPNPVPESEWDNLFYVNIDKAASLAGMTVHQARYLLNSLELPIGRGEGRNWHFTKADVHKLRLAYQLSSAGHDKAEIARQLQ